MFESYQQLTKPPLPPWLKVALTLWIVTLPVTLLLAALSAMASEAGYSWHTYLFMWSAFTYPLSVIAAFWFRRKRPILTLLPFVNIALWLFSGSGFPATHF